MTKLVNEPLYTALVDTYGDVAIQSGGDVGDFRKAYETRNGRERVVYVLSAGGRRGEQYRLNCPFCGDGSKRCYVGYLFGAEDAKTRSRNYFNWVCYNEHCEKIFDNCRDLYAVVEPYLRYGFSSTDVSARLKLGVAPTVTETGDSAVIIRPVPGILADLTRLKPGDYLYPVAKYLHEDRNFDLSKLDSMYGVKAIAEPYFDKRLYGRVYTPFYRCGYRVGWNARAVPNFSENGADKYLNSPGGLAGICYGLLAALETRVVMLVEGVTDRWAAGISSVAILGKKLNSGTIRRLATEFSKLSPELVVIVLDPELSSDDAKHNRPHHCIVAKQAIERFWPGPVEIVMLPDGHDPSSFGGFNLGYFVSSELRKLGHARAAEIIGSTTSLSTATRK